MGKKRHYSEIKRVLDPLKGEIIFLQGFHSSGFVMAIGAFEETTSGRDHRIWLNSPMYYSLFQRDKGHRKKLILTGGNDTKVKSFGFPVKGLARVVDSKRDIVIEDEEEIHKWNLELSNWENNSKQTNRHVLTAGIYGLLRVYGI